MKVLIVGNGGREHALLWRMARDEDTHEFHITRGTPGALELAADVDVSPTDVDGVVRASRELGADLVVVGPEAPLVAGLADRLAAEGIGVFGPTAAAARIEGSKVFTKELMKKIGVPTASFEVFTDAAKALDYIDAGPESCVVKADGLAGGKGAIVCRTREQARQAVESIMREREFGEAGDSVVVEELMEGEELSVLALTDGSAVVPLVPSQDHKPVGEGDSGPNTGGMGAYAPVLIAHDKLVEEVVQTIMQPVVDELGRMGSPYRGCLYAGLMVSEQGPRVVEFNCRFGDPETQAVLPLVEGDFTGMLGASASGSLDGVEVAVSKKAAVCVVLASGGYPRSYEKGKPISFGPGLEGRDDLVVFHAGTASKDGTVVSAGGRVLGVTGIGDNALEAAARAYEGIENLSFEGMYFRRDIAFREITRIRAMRDSETS